MGRRRRRSGFPRLARNSPPSGRVSRYSEWVNASRGVAVMSDSLDLDGMTPNLATAPGPGSLAPAPADSASVPGGRDRSEDNRLAADLKALVAGGALAEARERFGALVVRHQRRASRIAYHYLGDAADADEAVQDAFLKV